MEWIMNILVAEFLRFRHFLYTLREFDENRIEWRVGLNLLLEGLCLWGITLIKNRGKEKNFGLFV